MLYVLGGEDAHSPQVLVSDRPATPTDPVATPSATAPVLDPPSANPPQPAADDFDARVDEVRLALAAGTIGIEVSDGESLSSSKAGFPLYDQSPMGSHQGDAASSGKGPAHPRPSHGIAETAAQRLARKYVQSPLLFAVLVSLIVVGMLRYCRAGTPGQSLSAKKREAAAPPKWR